MREDSGAIKIHALRRARLVAAHGEQQAEIDPEAAAASSADYLANLKGAALAGSWAVEGGPVLNLAIFSAGGIG